MIEARSFGVRYGEEPEQVLRDISFRLAPGERVLLLGSSGSGKSTLVSSLIGLIPHSHEAELQGHIAVQNLPTIHSSPGELSHRVGVVFQDPDSQLTMLTVEEEIAFGLENLGIPPKEMDHRIATALEQVGLGEYRSCRVELLSGGMKQRLVIGAILAMEPDLLVLDEPTANLDPRGAREVSKLLLDISRRRRELAILLVEHRLDEMASLATRVLLLDSKGRLALDLPAREAFGSRAETLRRHQVWIPTESAAALQAGLEPSFGELPLREALEKLAGSLEQDQPGRSGLLEWCQPAKPAPRSPEEPDPVLFLDKITVSYPRASSGGPVLKDLSFSLAAGELCALAGPNGSGKSTLAATAMGLIPPQKGRVFLEGRDLSRIPLRERSRRAGFVFQNPEHQFVTDSVFEEVAFTLRQQGCNDTEIRERTGETLNTLGLGDLARRNPFSLSFGQKRRLSAASMLVAHRKLLIFDEPTFGQDPRALEELLNLLDLLASRNTAVLVITHDMDLIWSRAHRVALLLDGVIALEGTPEDVFAREALLHRGGLIPPSRYHLHKALSPRSHHYEPCHL
ncbi:ABC transporter ATP-binding protein [Alkalispirochaeta americana]|nr:ABC transporter ATP-binding protein [Alkalispirochaeta americana]